MNAWIILKVALRSLRRTLLRSVLTMLGIIIGVGAVIAMVGIGNGAKARIQSTLAGLDSNRLTFNARMPRSEWRGGQPPPLPAGDGLNRDDYLTLKARLTGVEAISPTVSEQGVGVSANGRSTSAQVTGLDAAGFMLNARRLVRGAAFGPGDVRTAASVCVLSQSASDDLFPGRDAVGRLVRIKDTPFVVIGVMADTDNPRSFDPDARDISVYLPYTSLLRRLNREAKLSLTLKASDPAQLPALQQQVYDLLEERRGNRKAEFTANDLSEMIKNYTQSVDTMTLLLASIAGISLLVGGIGIMNIMLVSVTERTREIGIRLAIGTRGRDVLRQFVIEAVILSVLGGLIGIGLGITAARLITRLNGWPTQVTPEAIVGAFLTSAAIGIFFGWYPARKAAALDPIEALRYE